MKIKISDEEVLRRAGMQSIEAMIATAQLRWVGHVSRMSHDRIPRILLYGEIFHGKRKQGGQKVRYKDVTKRHFEGCKINHTTWELPATTAQRGEGNRSQEARRYEAPQ